MKVKVALLVVITKRFFNVHFLIQLFSNMLKILRSVQHASVSAHSTLVSPCCEKLLAVYYFNRYI